MVCGCVFPYLHAHGRYHESRLYVVLSGNLNTQIPANYLTEVFAVSIIILSAIVSCRLHGCRTDRHSSWRVRWCHAVAYVIVKQQSESSSDQRHMHQEHSGPQSDCNSYCSNYKFSLLYNLNISVRVQIFLLLTLQHLSFLATPKIFH